MALDCGESLSLPVADQPVKIKLTELDRKSCCNKFLGDTEEPVRMCMGESARETLHQLHLMYDILLKLWRLVIISTSIYLCTHS